LPVRVIGSVYMPMVRPVRFPKSVNRYQYRPGGEDFAYPVIPFSVPEQTVMDRLVHDYTETILSRANPHHSSDVEEGIPITITGKYRQGNSKPFQRDLQNPSPRLYF
jgi:hypothetical protein